MTIHLEFVGIKMVAEYNYQPAERQTMDHPGCDESFEVIGVHTEHGDDILPMFESYDQLWDPITDAVSEAHRDHYADEY